MPAARLGWPRSWRNNYLTGAQELRGSIGDTEVSSAGMAAALTITQLSDAGTDGVQFDGDPKIFTTITGLTDQPDPVFPIVTP